MLDVPIAQSGCLAVLKSRDLQHWEQPAIIDWPAYWRPASWAYAVAVTDALCWYQAPPQLAARWSHLPSWGQMLVRALIYRIATDDAALGPAGWTPERTRAYRPVIDLAITCADSTPN